MKIYRKRTGHPYHRTTIGLSGQDRSALAAVKAAYQATQGRPLSDALVVSVALEVLREEMAQGRFRNTAR